MRARKCFSFVESASFRQVRHKRPSPPIARRPRRPALGTVPALGSGEADRLGTVRLHSSTPSSTVPSPRDSQHTRATPPPSTPHPDPRPTWQTTRRRSGTRTRHASCPVSWARRCVARALDRSRAASSPTSLFPRLSRSRRPRPGRASSRSRRGDRRDPAPPSRVKRADRTHAARPPPPRAGRLRRHRRRLPHREEEGRRGHEVSPGTARRGPSTAPPPTPRGAHLPDARPSRPRRPLPRRARYATPSRGVSHRRRRSTR